MWRKAGLMFSETILNNRLELKHFFTIFSVLLLGDEKSWHFSQDFDKCYPLTMPLTTICIVFPFFPHFSADDNLYTPDSLTTSSDLSDGEQRFPWMKSLTNSFLQTC